jgi:Core-2/I-Branching enzyme
VCRQPAAISQPSLVTAHKALLRAALEDPRNTMFILISEVCVPLHHPALMWSQLMAEAHVSRVTGKQEDMQRWWDGMQYGSLNQERFLKSSQWVGLSRMHAMLVVEDDHVWPRFDKYCRTGVRALLSDLYFPASVVDSALLSRKQPVFCCEAS